MEQMTECLLLLGGLSALYGMLGVAAGVLEWLMARFQHTL
jgi:hypothetical protein